MNGQWERCTSVHGGHQCTRQAGHVGMHHATRGTNGGREMSDRYDEGRELGQLRERAAILTMLREQAANEDGGFNADYVEAVGYVIADIEAGMHRVYYPATTRLGLTP